MRHEVQTHTICDGWVNTWTEEDAAAGLPVKVTFSTRQDAQAELDEFLADVKEAVMAGDMEQEYSPDDYRIVPVEGT